MTNEEKTIDKAAKAQSVEDLADNQITVEQWLAIRKDAGLHIDPETAEVMWIYANNFDPYGVYPDLPDVQTGREYFARSREAKYGSRFATCPMQPETPCGKSTSLTWHFT